MAADQQASTASIASDKYSSPGGRSCVFPLKEVHSPAAGGLQAQGVAGSGKELGDTALKIQEFLQAPVIFVLIPGPSGAVFKQLAQNLQHTELRSTLGMTW